MKKGRPIIGINADTFRDGYGGITGIRQGYWEAVYKAGGVPVMVPHLPNAAHLGRFLDGIDAMVMTGGDDLLPQRVGAEAPDCEPMAPQRDTTDFLLLRALLRRKIPTLAICLGIQELNLHCGGTLWLDLPSQYPASTVNHRGPKGARYVEHEVELAEGGWLEALWKVRRARVNSSHHQAIKTLGRGLEALAWAPDGIVEACRVKSHPFFVGVQWHPERLQEDPLELKLFAALVKKALE